eukprot:scaffold620_cov177-Ochromonas_danica.AAC.6
MAAGMAKNCHERNIWRMASESVKERLVSLEEFLHLIQTVVVKTAFRKTILSESQLDDLQLSRIT